MRQRLHCFVSLLYACDVLTIDQLIVNGFLFCFSCQMYFESSVVFWCLTCLKECLCLSYLSLKGGSVSPIYTLVLLVSVTSAL